MKRRTAMELVVKHVDQTPSPLSRRAEQPIPDALDAIVMHRLEKRPRTVPPTRRCSGESLLELARDLPWSERDAEQ